MNRSEYPAGERGAFNPGAGPHRFHRQLPQALAQA